MVGINGRWAADLIKLDPREAYPSDAELTELESRGLGPISKPEGSERAICILCESGYHDAAWEVSHIMQCGCPCHAHNPIKGGN